MIITHPIDIPYDQERQQRVTPDAIFNNSAILSGLYPMGKLFLKKNLTFCMKIIRLFAAGFRHVAHAVKHSFIIHRNMNAELLIPRHGGHDPNGYFIFSA
jgi:hypothetical protein